MASPLEIYNEWQRGVSCKQICQTNLDTDCLCRPEAVQHSQRSSCIPGCDRLR
jgi:hypothetical protein